MEPGLYVRGVDDFVTVLKCEGGPWGMDSMYTVLLLWPDGTIQTSLISSRSWRRVL